MTIEQIKKYIDKTPCQNPSYSMSVDEWMEIIKPGDILNAAYLAFCYGRAKGYRMAKKEAAK